MRGIAQTGAPNPGGMPAARSVSTTTFSQRAVSSTATRYCQPSTGECGFISKLTRRTRRPAPSSVLLDRTYVVAESDRHGARRRGTRRHPFAPAIRNAGDDAGEQDEPLEEDAERSLTRE